MGIMQHLKSSSSRKRSDVHDMLVKVHLEVTQKPERSVQMEACPEKHTIGEDTVDKDFKDLVIGKTRNKRPRWEQLRMRKHFSDQGEHWDYAS